MQEGQRMKATAGAFLFKENEQQARLNQPHTDTSERGYNRCDENDPRLSCANEPGSAVTASLTVRSHPIQSNPITSGLPESRKSWFEFRGMTAVDLSGRGEATTAALTVEEMRRP